MAGSTAAGDHLIDTGRVLSSIGEAVYDWDIEGDTLTWSPNALSIFKVDDPLRIASGAAFNEMIDPASPSTRAETILLCEGEDTGNGVPYRFQFAVSLDRETLTWFEDTGRWFAGADGSASSAHGVVRKIEAPITKGRSEFAAARLDSLTGAYERSPFIRLMADGLRKAGQKSASSCFMLIAINDLGFINKTYGFEASDRVIAEVARRLKNSIRGKDRIVRYSGTKLGLFLSPFDPASLKEAAERVNMAVASQPIDAGQGPVAVSLHIGAIIAPRDGTQPIELMRRAEEALSEARQLTSGYLSVYARNEAREEARKRNLTDSDDVLKALNERRVVIAHEPVLCAKTRIPAFSEALVRVRNGEGSLLGASAIIPTAERFGLIKFVDTRVLELAVQHLAADKEARLSVNVSMRTATTPEWMAALQAVLAANPGVSERLILEVTETAAMSDIDATAVILRTAKDLGCQIAIDDFGSGHTSFRSLRSLPVDILKIDGVFVQNLSTSVDDRFFVRTLVDLAKHVGVKTVAEWVQDEEAAALLADWGVDYLQGEFCGMAAVPGEAPEKVTHKRVEANPFIAATSAPRIRDLRRAG